MAQDGLNYDELLHRLAVANGMVRRLTNHFKGGNWKHWVDFSELSEAEKALLDALKAVQQLKAASAQKPNSGNEKLQARSVERTVAPGGPLCRQEWLFAALESLPDAVIITDAVGRVLFMNHCAQELTGSSLAEARGKDLEAIFRLVNEVTHVNTEQPVSRLLRQGKCPPTHVLFVKSDGGEIPLEYHGTVNRGENGRTESLVFVLRDVSQRQLMEQALRNSERLTITGRLAATVAHEIRNPLESVGNLLYLIAQGTKEAPTKNYASLASQELDRIIQITGQFLTFQRESAHPIPVQIQEIVDNVLALYARKISSAGITVEKQIPLESSLLAQPGEMRQIVANFVGNAIDAVERNQGRIQIRVHFSHHWKTGRPGLRLVIADNGPGITAEIREKIFEPFFTTKGEHGTGLGLWISRGIINKYEGAMRLRSSIRPERSGTCFSVFLPT